jgi:hypothetical protein
VTVAVRIRDYSQLTQALAARRRQLGLLQLELDERAGLASGYSGKLECHDRHFGKLSLPMVLAALDVDLYLAPRSAVDPVAEQRVLGPQAAGNFARVAQPPTGEY